MYVRIARFEGADNESWDERIAEIRARTASLIGAEDGPPITRAMMLVDREHGRGAAVTFCATEADLHKVNEFMNTTSPPGGSGTRASVELFEVAVDSDQL
jgi:hypothetical protein